MGFGVAVGVGAGSASAAANAAFKCTNISKRPAISAAAAAANATNSASNGNTNGNSNTNSNTHSNTHSHANTNSSGASASVNRNTSSSNVVLNRCEDNGNRSSNSNSNVSSSAISKSKQSSTSNTNTSTSTNSNSSNNCSNTNGSNNCSNTNGNTNSNTSSNCNNNSNCSSNNCSSNNCSSNPCSGSTTPSQRSQASQSSRQSEETASHSALAVLLGSLTTHASAEARVDGDLYDLADSALRSMHDQSQQHQPNLERLLESFPAVDRRETMDWLVQAFEVVGFPDSMLYASALFLDRYHASRARSEVPARESHRQLLAAVVLALKTDTRDDLRFTLKQVVSHLGRDRVSFRDVVSTELKMLSCLRFTVSTPTALEFLEVLSTRVSHYDQRVVALAEFLLQLTLGDAVVHWGHSHSVLAASTLSMASLTLQVNPDALTSIREDLCVLCPQLEEPAVDLVRCCADLHALWVESTLPDSEIYSFAQHVRTKFGHRRYRSVATIVPPAYAPVLVQEPVPASP